MSKLFPLLSLLALTAAESHAAPLPVNKEAKKQELDGLWADLAKDEPAASRAVLKLFGQPGHAVPLLKDRLPALTLDADKCKQLLKDLGSDDEKTWKAARATFEYLDPRLAVDLPTLMADVTDNPARSRLVEVCGDRDAESLSGQAVQLRATGADAFNFTSGTGSWWAEHKIEKIGSGGFWNPKRTWTRAVRGVAVLEQIGTPDAVKVLEQLAGGHADAFPTKAAKESLERMKK